MRRDHRVDAPIRVRPIDAALLREKAVQYNRLGIRTSHVPHEDRRIDEAGCAAGITADVCYIVEAHAAFILRIDGRYVPLDVELL